MSEMTMFETELMEKVRLNRRAEVQVTPSENESFTEAMDKTAARVMQAIAKLGLKELAGHGESLISNMKYDEELGWVYSVRMQKTEE
jgi:hypothetical protein